jgi:hypothetical protein
LVIWINLAASSEQGFKPIPVLIRPDVCDSVCSGHTRVVCLGIRECDVREQIRYTLDRAFPRDTDSQMTCCHRTLPLGEQRSQLFRKCWMREVAKIQIMFDVKKRAVIAVLQ